ncbi:winged helix-turn-helix transcriptional regulator [Cystobacter ferrugineus]|uniref:Transcriptional regulator n=1 Tax=Cystobacter ferrugineus TaxID=83449 RepID=A0A1L9BHN4_9BACT|nr:helix-turn-helix domain-containing protein [Cystobacter ferrugineus]OJH41739.1 transcriptional regulator [Cystobacter ferrugineus]
MKLGNLNLPSEVCRSVGDVLGRVGDKWAVLVIVTLADGSQRFNELRRGIGTVSQKMLTATLRGLERDGYVTRKVTPTIPPRVDYELTQLGRDVLVPLNALAQWALAHREHVEAARKTYDERVGKEPAEDE